MLARSGAMEMGRPDKIRATRSGGFANVEMTFDGKTLTLLGNASKVRGGPACNCCALQEAAQERAAAAWRGADEVGGSHRPLYPTESLDKVEIVYRLVP